jgi:hypothetical protein
LLLSNNLPVDYREKTLATPYVPFLVARLSMLFKLYSVNKNEELCFPNFPHWHSGC